MTSELMQWAASKNRGDLFWMLTHQENQSGFSDDFFSKKIVVIRSFTADSNLLQPTESVNRTPTHVAFSRVSQHTFQCSHFGSRCLARITSCHHAFGCAFDLILFDPLLCTLHRLSHLPFHSLVLHLHLSCGLVRWEVPCVLPRKRS